MLGKIKDLFNRRKYFIVTSHGNTGTMWLSIRMNNHPKIFCTHSYQWPIMEPLEKLRIEKAGFDLLGNANKHFWKLSLDQFFDQHEDSTKKKIIGNVHGFTFGRFWQMLPSLSAKRKRNLKLLNMVRHPITRINSCYHHWTEGGDNKFQFIKDDIKNNCNHILEFINKRNYKVELTYEKRAFIVALLQSEHVAQDISLTHKEGIGNIIFEELTKDEDYYSRIFNGLTKLNPVNDKSVDNDKSIQHTHSPHKLSAKEQFDKWEPWKQESFRFVANRSNMKKIYKKYDYDMSFI